MARKKKDRRKKDYGFDITRSKEPRTNKQRRKCECACHETFLGLLDECKTHCRFCLEKKGRWPLE